ncbi:MAG: hypothetical protein R2752_04665 [Vicinamibacterales bacterium]
MTSLLCGSPGEPRCQSVAMFETICLDATGARLGTSLAGMSTVVVGMNVEHRLERDSFETWPESSTASYLG